ETARDVFAKVTRAARQVLERQLDALLAGRAPRRPQDESQATYFGGRKPEDGRIDWRRDARAVFNLVRAVTHPYPGAFTEIGGRRFYVWWAAPAPLAAGHGRPGEVIGIAPLTIACGEGALVVKEWQWQNDPAPHSGNEHGLASGVVLGAASMKFSHSHPSPRAGERTGGGAAST